MKELDDLRAQIAQLSADMENLKAHVAATELTLSSCAEMIPLLRENRQLLSDRIEQAHEEAHSLPWTDAQLEKIRNVMRGLMANVLKD